MDEIDRMNHIMNRASEFVWNEYFWLPPNVTWMDLKATPEKSYPQFHALLYPIPLACVIFFVRLLVERTVYEPFGVMLHVRGRRKKNVPQHVVLEAAFASSSKISHHDAMGLGKRCDMSERQVQRWFRHREAERRSSVSPLDKFKETGWRFTFYLGIFTYGLWSLWDKPWFRDSSEFWTNYPFQSVDTDIWWYYMLEMGFYWSLLISQFFDVKRKDFWEMFFHHIITIALMCFSWTDNTVRVGSMVMLIHDAVDFLLEGSLRERTTIFPAALCNGNVSSFGIIQAAKLAKYAKQTRLSVVLFGVFAVVWIFTRLFLFPYKVLRYTCPCPLGDACFPAFHLYNCLLGSLQVLHVFWTFTILRVIYRALNTGKAEDVRSDTEESGDNPLSDDATSPVRDTSAPQDDNAASGDKLVKNGTGCYLNDLSNNGVYIMGNSATGSKRE